MPMVQLDFIEGRTVEQKREMVKKITECLVETTKCSAEAVTIIIRDMPTHNVGLGGKLRSDI